MSQPEQDRYPGPYVLWRQDDHGNMFPVQRCATWADAEALLATYKARGHKQTYWLEPVEGDEHATA